MSSRSDSTVGQTQDVTMTDNNEDSTTDCSTEDQDQSNDSMTEYEHDSDLAVVADNDDDDDEDDDFSSDDEEETPRMSLTQGQALEAGAEPIFWYAGDQMPDFRSLDLDESDVLRLCREFNINPHTKKVGLNFRTDSPFWELRCAFVGFLHER